MIEGIIQRLDELGVSIDNLKNVIKYMEVGIQDDTEYILMSYYVNFHIYSLVFDRSGEQVISFEGIVTKCYYEENISSYYVQIINAEGIEYVQILKSIATTISEDLIDVQNMAYKILAEKLGIGSYLSDKSIKIKNLQDLPDLEVIGAPFKFENFIFFVLGIDESTYHFIYSCKDGTYALKPLSSRELQLSYGNKTLF